jgi:hypothetical protein
MKRLRNFSAKLALSTFLFSSLAGVAMAQDAAKVADHFKAILSGQGIDIAWEGISGSGADFALTGVSFAPAGESEKLKIGDLSFKGVAEADGGYTVETISTSPYTMTKDGATVDISPFTLTGVVLPADANDDPIKRLLFYQQADLDSFSVKMGDKPIFGLQKLHIDVTPPEEGKAMEFAGSAEKFNADLSLVEDPQAKAVIEALGYQNLSGSFEMEGGWQPSDGRMGLTQYDITIDGAGTLGLTFDLGGYTPAFIKSLQDMQKQMAAAPEGADKSAQGLAMLGLLQQLTFYTASVRYDDDSLASKLLEFFAKQQGLSAADLANQLKGLVPFGMAQLNNPELTAEVTAAVSKFLDDPKSIEIAAEPAQPVPFALIMAGGMSAPQDLPKTLGVSVTANED